MRVYRWRLAGLLVLICALAGCGRGEPGQLPAGLEDARVLQEWSVPGEDGEEGFTLWEVAGETDVDPSRFLLVSHETGLCETLPTAPAVVALREIVSGSYFIFDDTGRNGESTYSSFPSVLHCFRVRPAPTEGEPAFQCLWEERLFLSGETAELRSDDAAVLAGVSVGLEEVGLLFDPPEGDSGAFWADFLKVPGTSVHLDDAGLSVTLRNCALGPEAAAPAVEDHPLIADLALAETGNTVELQIAFHEPLSGYLARRGEAGDRSAVLLRLRP